VADDSPETITCFQLLSIQHPPGYPLDTMLGKIFSLLPLANQMMKANLMSAIFHVLSSFILFFIVMKILKNEKEKFIVYVTAMLAVMFYLFSNTAFMQAISAKGSIYTLHSFLTAVMFFSLLQVNKGAKYFYLVVFVYSLSLTNHWPSAVVMLPGIFLYLYLVKFKMNRQILLYSGLFLVIGLTPFIFLFIRTLTNPDMMWPVKNLQDFLWILGRTQYADIDTGHTINDSIRFFKYFFTDMMPSQYPFLIILLVLPGIFSLYKYNKVFCLSSLAVVFCMILGVASVNIIKEKMEWVVKPYFVFVYMFMAIYIAFVFFKILLLIKKPLITKIISTLLFCLFFVLLYKNCPNYYRYYLAYDYVQNIFKSMPDDSAFFSEGDISIAGGIYAVNIEKKKNTTIISPFLNHQWYRDIIETKIKIQDNYTGRKDFIRNIVLLNCDKQFFYSNTYTKEWIDFNLLQRGIVYEVATDYFKPVKKYDFYKDFLIYSYRGAFNKYLYDEGTKVFILNNLGRMWFNAGKFYEEKTEKMNALYYFKRAFNFFKDDLLAYKIGLYYYDLEEIKKSEYYFKEGIKINKKNIQIYGALIALGVLKNDYNMMRKYAKEILKYDKNNRDAINLLKEIGK